MHKVLIAGGAGFLGSHLCERLVNAKFDVVCVDNFLTGREDNIHHLRSKANFELIHHDISTPFQVESDQIFNLACPASPLHYQRNPIQTTRTNVLGALSLLDIAKQCNAPILQASTSEIYGDPIVHPQTESYWGQVNPIGVRSCYDEGKRCAESLFFDYHRQHHVAIKVVRIFNTYGPRMHSNDGRVVSNFITQALRGEDITIYGDGLQTRSFCYATDMVEALIKMMESDKAFTGPVNLGNPTEHTILELAETILRLTGSKSKLSFKALPNDDPKQRRPDIELAKANLTWQPQVSLIDGLIECIAYIQMQLDT